MKKFMFGILFMLGALAGAWFVIGDYTIMFNTEIHRAITLLIAFVGFIVGATKPDGVMK